jgi:hypothetical protein
MAGTDRARVAFNVGATGTRRGSFVDAGTGLFPFPRGVHAL